MINTEFLLLSGAALWLFFASRRTANPYEAKSMPTPLQTVADRYNNPLNIKFNPANAWVGQDPARSGEFAYFTAPEYGYRAAFVLLKNYVGKGYNTIEKVINRWAPSRENPTQDYIDFVCEKTGLWANTPLKPIDYAPLIEAMAIFEGGKVDLVALQKGYKLAFG